MSSLVLVRHAQASFFSDNYDQLSETGRAQSALLGDYWVRRGLQFDAVYVGPRTRQQQTAELVGARFQQARIPWPAPTLVPELDEFDLGGLLQHLAPEMARKNREFAELAARYEQGTDADLRLRDFQKAFEILTRYWLDDQRPRQGLESWAAFRERVGRSIRGIVETAERGSRVVVFTSGGFIGTAIQQALAAPDPMALEISWRIRNCSLNEFVFTPGRLTLDGFNGVPHLENTDLWTYR